MRQHHIAMLPGSVTGKPLSVGGTRTHAGGTSAGVVVCARAVFEALELSLPGRRAVIQGFGKVGGPLAFLLTSAGMRVVAASRGGTLRESVAIGRVYAEAGIDGVSGDGRRYDFVLAPRESVTRATGGATGPGSVRTVG